MIFLLIYPRHLRLGLIEAYDAELSGWRRMEYPRHLRLGLIEAGAEGDPIFLYRQISEAFTPRPH